MPFLYKNKEYVDWIRAGELEEDTVVEGADLVTLPEKTFIRDMTVTIAGVFNGAQVIVEYSPDNMETPKNELVPSSMDWFAQQAGTFTAAGTTPAQLMGNIDIAEGWLRIRVAGAVTETDVAVKTRPRVEKVI
jgi:hypothetical protein